jgi:hypothetical protein
LLREVVEALERLLVTCSYSWNESGKIARLNPEGKHELLTSQGVDVMKVCLPRLSRKTDERVAEQIPDQAIICEWLGASVFLSRLFAFCGCYDTELPDHGSNEAYDAGQGSKLAISSEFELTLDELGS